MVEIALGVPAEQGAPEGRGRVSMGDKCRPIFFATFGGKSGAKATHRISGRSAEQKA